MTRKPGRAGGKKRRPYDSSRRTELAAQTRAQIVAAAHRLLDAPTAPALTLDEVAKAAGVSRATIYNQFGSRRALLAAVLEDMGRVLEYERVRSAQLLADPRAALEATIRECSRCWARSPLAIRRILALGELDPEIGALNTRYEQYRKGEMAVLVHRLVTARLLGTGVTQDQAMTTVGALTSPRAAELFGEDVDARELEDRLVYHAFAALGMAFHPR